MSAGLDEKGDKGHTVVKQVSGLHSLLARQLHRIRIEYYLSAAIIQVLEFPPRFSRRSQVSAESRYGMKASLSIQKLRKMSSADRMIINMRHCPVITDVGRRRDGMAG